MYSISCGLHREISDNEEFSKLCSYQESNPGPYACEAERLTTTLSEPTKYMEVMENAESSGYLMFSLGFELEEYLQ